MNKQEQLAALGRRRQDATCPGYRRIAEFHDGAYDCALVSPYSKAAGNRDANVMLVLQDWSSEEYLDRPLDPRQVELGQDPRLPTNRRLSALLEQVFGLRLSETYGTNVFPFIKPGKMQGRPPPLTLLIQMAREYTLPQIEIVGPRLVICLGKDTFNAVAMACGRPRFRTTDLAVRAPFRYSGAMVWCQAHPGARGQNNRNRHNRRQVEADWRQMKEWYSSDR